ncbi:MAG: AAA family ATPase [Myxococcales bacterium]|nr:AAA family ATPase [Myxococcales bacterium]MCB9552781.1 AAA family ATPase [Myxococcales bacterium]
MKRRFVERDALVDAALAALVAGEHLLVIGPPGTAKSQLAAALCDAITGARGFEWLLTRFTTPEELFGPVSLRALEDDRYERLVAGKLPDAHVVFLDEVFKASSAILNALLTVLNERRFHNGARALDIPLVTLIAASNELPDEDALQALYDRFLVRVMVDYVEEDHRFARLLTLPAPTALPAIGLAEVEAARAAAAALPVEAQVIRDLTALRRELRGHGVVASDRRWRQALGFMRAWAWLRGRAAVSEAELGALRHVLWSDPDERDAVQAALDAVLGEESARLQTLVFEARAFAGLPEAEDEDERARAALEARVKLEQIRAEGQALLDAARRRGRRTEALAEMLAEIDGLRETVRRALGSALQ